MRLRSDTRLGVMGFPKVASPPRRIIQSSYFKCCCRFLGSDRCTQTVVTTCAKYTAPFP